MLITHRVIHMKSSIIQAGYNRTFIRNHFNSRPAMVAGNNIVSGWFRIFDLEICLYKINLVQGGFRCWSLYRKSLVVGQFESKSKISSISLKRSVTFARIAGVHLRD